jgi:hypothetical protein
MPPTAYSLKSRPIVPRRVKDFIEISDYTSLDSLIGYLKTIHDNLPAGHEAELKIRGDDVFGRRLTITYFRDQTPEEAELEAKYLDSGSEENPRIDSLRHKLDSVPFRRKKGD